MEILKSIDFKACPKCGKSVQLSLVHNEIKRCDTCKLRFELNYDEETGKTIIEVNRL